MNDSDELDNSGHYASADLMMKGNISIEDKVHSLERKLDELMYKVYNLEEKIHRGGKTKRKHHNKKPKTKRRK